MTREDFRAKAAALLEELYPEDHDEALASLVDLVATHRAACASSPRHAPPDHRTAVLITYGDAVQQGEDVHPLATLRELLTRHVGDRITDIHILPMFPSSSDDGFSVIDHRAVDPALGTWDDIAALSSEYRVMFDFVANHVSSGSEWFQRFLRGDESVADRFIRYDPDFDTSLVVRPRTSPLFHAFATPDGADVRVWTTFSEDQCDVDLSSPRTLLALTEVLLDYLSNGASTIRLDAVGFLWKQSGTPCIHLPQTHAIVKLWRLVLEHVRPGSQIVTETNVPHAENISYFGNGSDEAHQVYQFALPPLVLHAFATGSNTVLSRWASTVDAVSPSATYFNFLASHDGIGMRPVEGILGEAARGDLVRRVLDNGGLVSMNTDANGSETVYELNINYLDALADHDELGDPEAVARKGLAAHAILLTVVGIPGLYYHSLFGSSSDREGAWESGIARRINREHLDAGTLAHGLANDLRRRTVFEGITHMLGVRRQHPAFSPYSDQHVEDLDPRVFAVRRGVGTDDELLCIANLTTQDVTLPVGGLDALTGTVHDRLTLSSYGVAWLAPVDVR